MVSEQAQRGLCRLQVTKRHRYLGNPLFHDALFTGEGGSDGRAHPFHLRSRGGTANCRRPVALTLSAGSSHAPGAVRYAGTFKYGSLKGHEWQPMDNADLVGTQRCRHGMEALAGRHAGSLLNSLGTSTLERP